MARHPQEGLFHLGKANAAQLAGEILVVVFGDVGVEAGQTEALKQVRLPEIAEIVIYAAALAPARDRENIAREYREKEEQPIMILASFMWPWFRLRAARLLGC